MQRMTIIGLSNKIRWVAEKMYNTLPNTKCYQIKNKLIVETELTEADKKEITEQYNKTANILLFEDI